MSEATSEHLTSDEVDKLIEAVKTNRHGHRDALMVLPVRFSVDFDRKT